MASPNLRRARRTLWPDRMQGEWWWIGAFVGAPSQAVRALVQDQQLQAMLIMNSGLSVISSRDGGGGLGEPLAQQISRQTSIPYVATYTAYPVTGQLMDWVESLRKIGVEVNMPASFSNDRGLQVVETFFEYLAR